MTVLVGPLSLLISVVLLVAPARYLARIFFSRARAASESFLNVVLLFVLLTVALVVLTGGLGLLRRELLLMLSALVFAGSKIGTHLQAFSRAHPAPAIRRQSWLVFWPAVPAAVVLVLDVLATLPTSPVNWDAMTYHLYFPARWIEAGQLFHIPTVFGDNSPAYAPQNGALFFTWQMALLGSDATTNVSQVVCLVFLALVLYRFSLLLGLRRQPAVMAAAMSMFLLPLRRWTLTANVDIFMIAFWIGGVFWLAQYLRRRELGSLVSCGLATGLAMGTKVLGLVLGGLPAGAMGLFLLGTRQARRLLVFSFMVALAGGGWFLHNLWRYGNPLFPLDWGGLGIHFAGVYSSVALRQSIFRVDLSRWFEVIPGQFGATTCFLMAIGLMGLFIMPTRGRLLGWALAAFIIFWPVYVFVVVPHNNQARFLIPALVISQLGWARWLDLVCHRHARGVLFALVVGLAGWSARPDLTWLSSLHWLAKSGVGLFHWIVPTLMAIAVGGWILWRRQFQLGWSGGLVLGFLATGVLTLATHLAGHSRIAFLAQADYRAWATGYLMLNDAESEPRRIAYSGINVPYTLTGPNLRHHVVYCNTWGEANAGLYEQWLPASRLFPVARPGLYRGDDDYATWRKCLDQQRIDTVVIFATIPLQRPPHWRLSGDFPIEREWMRQRPDQFHSILQSSRAEIYSVTRSE